jgi:hypothetical protein
MNSKTSETPDAVTKSILTAIEAIICSPRSRSAPI